MKSDPASFCQSQNCAAAIDAEGGILWHSAEGIAQSVKAGIEMEAETLKHGAESIAHGENAKKIY